MLMDIIKHRYVYFGISLLVIIPGMIALIIWGLPLGIDFSGGSLLDIRFNNGSIPQPAQIKNFYADNGFGDTIVQTSGENGLVIRSLEMSDEQRDQLVSKMEGLYATSITIQRFESVGPSVGQEVARRSAGAVGLAALGILAYITYAFRGVSHAYRYGTAAIIAMLHDVAVVLGVEAILAHFFHWELDSLFITALSP
jgi:preprotein translocase subunit SecF